MHTQTTLTDTDDEPATTDDTSTTDCENSSNAVRATLAPPDQRGGEGCCPWCLAAAETFEYHEDGSVGCGYCDAAIPVGIPWYERGEKIVV
ncbi:MAG TPA: hypothetical protein VFJ06_00565 [Halococcus sp.]|nr:hypothetical protein [Halococcus sp.]